MAEMTNDGFQVVTLGAVKADGTPDMANILFSFPCPHNAMTISQAVKIDEVSVPGRSGKVKQATGYDDTNITVTIRLDDREERAAPGEDGPYVITRSAAEQLTELQNAFRDRASFVSVPVTRTSTSTKTVKETVEQTVTTKTGKTRVKKVPTSRKLTTTTTTTTYPVQVPTVFSINSRLTNLCSVKTVLFKSMDVTEFEGETYIQVSMSFTEFEPALRVAEKRGRRISPMEQYAMDASEYDQLEMGSYIEDQLYPQEADYYSALEDDASMKFQHDLALLGDAAAKKLKEYRDSEQETGIPKLSQEWKQAYGQFSYNYDQKVAADEAKARSVVGNAQDTRRSHGYN